MFGHRTIKVYLAARYSRRDELKEYARALAKIKYGDEIAEPLVSMEGTVTYEVTSSWLHGIHSSINPNEHEPYAREDLADLLRSDIVISFTEAPGVEGRQRGGRHVEFGVALATGKLCIVVGPRENVFHWLGGVYVFDSFATLMRMNLVKLLDDHKQIRNLSSFY